MQQQNGCRKISFCILPCPLFAKPTRLWVYYSSRGSICARNAHHPLFSHTTHHPHPAQSDFNYLYIIIIVISIANCCSRRWWLCCVSGGKIERRVHHNSWCAHVCRIHADERVCWEKRRDAFFPGVRAVATATSSTAAPPIVVAKGPFLVADDERQLVCALRPCGCGCVCPIHAGGWGEKLGHTIPSYEVQSGTDIYTSYIYHIIIHARPSSR